MGKPNNKITVIFGPTASGKSNYAEQLAAKSNAVIINADSLQLYSQLKVLTARPDDKREHKLYGVLSGNERSNLFWWYRQAVKEIKEAIAANLYPILVGGTGMYLLALEKGVASIPEIPEELHNFLKQKYDSKNTVQIHAELAKLDPEAASLLKANDRQRVLRALEVIIHTGKSIFAWRQENKKLAELDITWIAMQPARENLYELINYRFLQMLENGAIEEIKSLLEQSLPEDHQIMKAVGVREIAAYLRGEITLDKAIELAQRETRRYAKRQMTWLRNQLEPDVVVN